VTQQVVTQAELCGWNIGNALVLILSQLTYVGGLMICCGLWWNETCQLLPFYNSMELSLFYQIYCLLGGIT